MHIGVMIFLTEYGIFWSHTFPAGRVHGVARLVITVGTRADCTQALALVEGIDAGALLGDKGYDTDVAAAQIRCIALWANIS